jgi:PD-(D/E)XK nuclease superfamily
MHDGLHASLTEQIIGCAMEVHRHLGPGLLESIYESALCFELHTAGMGSSGRLASLCSTRACCYRGIVPTSWSLRP